MSDDGKSMKVVFIGLKKSREKKVDVIDSIREGGVPMRIRGAVLAPFPKTEENKERNTGVIIIRR